jgi:hypothetical protein
MRRRPYLVNWTEKEWRIVGFALSFLACNFVDLEADDDNPGFSLEDVHRLAAIVARSASGAGRGATGSGKEVKKP